MAVDDEGVKLLALGKERLDRGGADRAAEIAHHIEHVLLCRTATHSSCRHPFNLRSLRLSCGFDLGQASAADLREPHSRCAGNIVDPCAKRVAYIVEKIPSSVVIERNARFRLRTKIPVRQRPMPPMAIAA